MGDKRVAASKVPAAADQGGLYEARLVDREICSVDSNDPLDDRSEMLYHEGAESTNTAAGSGVRGGNHRRSSGLLRGRAPRPRGPACVCWRGPSSRAGFAGFSRFRGAGRGQGLARGVVCLGAGGVFAVLKRNCLIEAVRIGRAFWVEGVFAVLEGRAVGMRRGSRPGLGAGCSSLVSEETLRLRTGRAEPGACTGCFPFVSEEPVKPDSLGRGRTR